jgi:hypothetical protein
MIMYKSELIPLSIRVIIAECLEEVAKSSNLRKILIKEEICHIFINVAMNYSGVFSKNEKK